MNGYLNVFRLLVGIGFGLSVAVFWVDNPTPVIVKFGLWELAQPVPLWLVALVCAAIGMVFPRLLLFRGAFGEYMERRRLQKRVAALEREVMQLRRLPFDGLTSESVGETHDEDLRLAPGATVTASIRPALAPPRPQTHAARPPAQSAPEILPAQTPAPAATAAPSGDPYASLFDAPDPALRGIEDAEISEVGG